MWEHPQIRKLLQIGNEVFPNPAPSPSSGNPLFRSLETSETKLLVNGKAVMWFAPTTTILCQQFLKTVTV